MFLHLGNGASVRAKDVIAIYDYNLFRRGDNAKFLQKRREQCKVVRTNENRETIKSLVITKDTIYLSVISPLALKRRSRLVYDMDTSE